MDSGIEGVCRWVPLAVRWMEELAQRTDADAFVVLGECDTERLEVLADRLRLVVRYAAPR